jgi:hypothetical protein
MHDDGDIGRPVHHVIAPNERSSPRAKNSSARPTQGVRELIEAILRRYPNLDAERVYEIVRERRHDVPRSIVRLVMDERRADRRRVGR